MKYRYSQYTEGTKKILKLSQTNTFPYVIKILNKKFLVLRNVFSPKYFNDTEIFAKYLPIKKGCSVLEIGSGTGVVSIFAKYKGARFITCIDINKEAVKNTLLNIELHGFKDSMVVRHGNLYKPLKNEKFDVIFWNTPFAFVKNKKITTLQKAVCDPFYKSTEIFIRDAKKHLTKNGKVFIGFSSTLGKMNLLRKIALKNNFSIKTIIEIKSQEFYNVNFEILELVENK